MITDNLLSFAGIGVAVSMVGAAGVNIASPNTIDILGSGVGTAPANIIGNRTLFGEDSGIGGERPQIQFSVGTAFTTATSATLNIAFQTAPDTGIGGGYQPGTWQTLNETGPMTAAQLTAGAIAQLDWPPEFPANAQNRFIRLLFQVPSGTDFTAGTILMTTTMVTDRQANKYAPRNYNV